MAVKARFIGRRCKLAARLWVVDAIFCLGRATIAPHNALPSIGADLRVVAEVKNYGDANESIHERSLDCAGRRCDVRGAARGVLFFVDDDDVRAAGLDNHLYAGSGRRSGRPRVS